MSYTLTLVAANNDLEEDHFRTLFNFLNEDSIEYDEEITWLKPLKSGAIEISETLSLQQAQKLRQVFNNDEIDIFCVECDKKCELFLAYMDSSIVTSETLDELADEASLKEKISSITECAMRGELDFHEAIKERVGLLKDLSEDALKRTLENTKISKGANTLLKTLKSNDIYCVLVSGGFTYFTNSIAESLGFDKNHGNILGLENNLLTGEVIEPILDKESKLTYLNQYASELNLPLSDSIAIGDGANDLMMLEAAGLGIGYHPKPLLQEKLINCIIHTDLTSVLYMQSLSA